MDLDFGTIVFFLAFLWFVFSEVRPKGGRKGGKASGRTVAPSRRPAEPLSRRAEPSRRPLHDTQAEAARLERILFGLDHEPEPPVVISLETPPQRVERPKITYDASAEEAERTRVEMARARDRALGAADHAEFDRRIRAAAATPIEMRRRPAPKRTPLREAIVWREILGPPVSLRE